ncbi:protein Mis18-alpha-like isoform X1 [Rhinoderma darwinii]|uniref:protein Mis18-alpha-like isoform X1 n=1 Tax=Rhinoderma darwinii TaxID=43563 RepID=UPI003F6755C0
MEGEDACRFRLSDLNRRIDYGTVYVCEYCQVPIGDTNDWSGEHVDDNVVLLKAVSWFVKRGIQVTSDDPEDAGSKYLPLSCRKCDNLLGKFYSFTPTHLNYKLDLYNIDNTVIRGCKLGENLQKKISASETPFTLETCHYYEDEIKKEMVVLEMLQDKLLQLEDDILTPADQSP